VPGLAEGRGRKKKTSTCPQGESKKNATKVLALGRGENGLVKGQGRRKPRFWERGGHPSLGKRGRLGGQGVQKEVKRGRPPGVLKRDVVDEKRKGIGNSEPGEGVSGEKEKRCQGWEKKKTARLISNKSGREKERRGVPFEGTACPPVRAWGRKGPYPRGEKKHGAVGKGVPR